MGRTTVDLRNLIESFVARSGVPAAGGAIVDTDGSVQVEVAGATRRRGGDPVVVEDRWHIGSCTKSLTAALYATLVEARMVRWESTLSELLPDIEGEIDPGWSNVTAEELLLCRAGVRSDLPRSSMEDAWADDRPPAAQRTSAAIAALSPAPEGRGTFRYSNLSYVVVGAVIDQVAGVPYEEALTRQILTPLGVTSAGLGAPPRIEGHAAATHLGPISLGRGRSAPPDDPRSDNPEVLNPAGRLHLSLADWATTLRLVLDGADVLEPTTVERLLTVPSGRGAMAMGWMPAEGLRGAAFGMQGSNTAWVATALLSEDRRRAAAVVTNDGRARLFAATARLGSEMLASVG